MLSTRHLAAPVFACVMGDVEEAWRAGFRHEPGWFGLSLECLLLRVCVFVFVQLIRFPPPGWLVHNAYSACCMCVWPGVDCVDRLFPAS